MLVTILMARNWQGGSLLLRNDQQGTNNSQTLLPDVKDGDGFLEMHKSMDIHAFMVH